MRALWSEDMATSTATTVDFTATPSLRPHAASTSRSPIVVGGHSLAAARRAGRLGDGFFPAKGDLPALLDEMRAAAEEAGRDPDAIEVTATGASLLAGGEQAVDEVGRLAELGVARL